jgi:hypothetical protein
LGIQLILVKVKLRYAKKLTPESDGFGTLPVFMTALSTILGAILFLPSWEYFICKCHKSQRDKINHYGLKVPHLPAGQPGL